ncbi:uncharacterized protein [Argopecten irradians]|uniref:uncharacterized protein n=1 Tax=Argopecten irradians TaxID=31199 RepID=UPI00371AF0E7
MEQELTKPAITDLPPPESPAVPKRFKDTTHEEIANIFESRQSKSTKKNTAWGIRIFQDWNIEKRGTPVDLTSVSAEDLAEILKHFYVAARPKSENELYHKNTLKNIRGAINRYFVDIGRNLDIVRDREFKQANGVLDGLLKQREKTGESKATAHKPIIEPEHLHKIATYLSRASSSPIILRHCVWYNLSVHFITRGMEFHHQLTPQSFEFHNDESGEYVTMTHTTQQKNHQGGLNSHEANIGKRMYSCPESPSCPVKMLKLLLEKTDKNATKLFNQYNKFLVGLCFSPQLTDVWFNTKPLAHRTFARFLSDICKSSDVDAPYTPHCLRATAIQYLNDTGYEARHIMFMSDHRCESSLRSYNRSVSTKQKRDISDSLSVMIKTRSAPSATVTRATGDIEMASVPSSQVSFSNSPSSCETTQAQPLVSNSNVNVSTSNITPGFFTSSSFENCVFNFNHNN